MDENEAAYLKRQVKSLKMMMLKMEERMKEMEKKMGTMASNSGMLGDSMDNGVSYVDNLEYLNAKMKLDHGDDIGSVQENIKTSLYLNKGYQHIVVKALILTLSFCTGLSKST